MLLLARDVLRCSAVPRRREVQKYLKLRNGSVDLKDHRFYGYGSWHKDTLDLPTIGPSPHGGPRLQV